MPECARNHAFSANPAEYRSIQAWLNGLGGANLSADQPLGVHAGPVHEIELAATPGSWRFRRAKPSADLRSQVVELWEVEGALQPFRETLLPTAAQSSW